MQNNPLRMKGRPSPSEQALDYNGISRSDSNGLLDLCEGDTRRKQGATLIARQIELENMKLRQFKVKEKVSEKNLALRQEKKANQYLEKIHKEHY